MEIVWGSSAIENLFSLLERVEEMFGSSVSMNVRQKIMSHVNTLLSFPYIGVRDSRFYTIEIRYLVNTPNIIFHTVSSDAIIIISILNTRQSPENIYQLLVDALKQNNLL